jgi:hypothetical protein
MRTCSIDADFDFSGVPYTSIRDRKRTGFLRAIYEEIEIKWPEAEEIDVLAEWCKREEIYRAFGFSRPLARDYIRKSILPDLTGATEDVEFLLIRDLSAGLPIGFFVVYEGRRFRDPNQELDVAIIDHTRRDWMALFRKIKLCAYSYLFAGRGAQSVHWIRRKKVEDEASGKKSFGKTLNYKTIDKRHVTTLRQFISLLKRSINSKKTASVPVICFEVI